MKIAVPYENGMVFQHFGHTAEFKFYEVENGQVTASEVVSTNGQGHGALVGFLAQHNTGGLSGPAQCQCGVLRRHRPRGTERPCTGRHPAVRRDQRPSRRGSSRLSGRKAPL